MPITNHSSDLPYKLHPNLEPFPIGVLRKKKWKSFIAKNGYLSLASRVNLKVYNLLSDAYSLWEQFTPKNSVFDLWDIRMSFYEGMKFEPYFMTVISQSGLRQKVLGVLPLWLDTDKKPPEYRFFGSNWPEDNTFFVRDPDIIPLLLLAAPNPLKLYCLKPAPDIQFLQDLKGFEKEPEKKYFLDLAGIKTLDDFLGRLKKKKRYNLRRDHKRIHALNPKIIYDVNSHLEILFDLNINRFLPDTLLNKDSHSNFEDERWKNVHRNLLKNAGKYQTRIISTVINSKVEAVEYALIFNNTYYAINAGANTKKYSGLGVFSNLELIKDALRLGATKIDFLEGNNNWKESWHFDYLYHFRFIK